VSHTIRLKFIRSILLAACLLLSIACNLLQGNPQPASTTVPLSSPTPAPGTIKGALVEGNGQPVQGVIIMLGRVSQTACPTEVSGWVQVENPPPEAKTDDKGAFSFNDVQPGCYLLSARLSTLAPSATLKDQAGNAYFNLPAGQTVDIGNILVKLP
jgi:hypothetical protein